MIKNRIGALSAVVFCSAALAFGSVSVMAEETAPAATEAEAPAEVDITENMKTYAEQITGIIVSLTDEDEVNYRKAKDETTNILLDAWDASKAELGVYESAEATDCTLKDGVYNVVVDAAFDNYHADFIYLITEEGQIEALTVDIQYPKSLTLQRAALNTLMGIGTVFVMLVLLSFLISLFKFIPDPEKKKREAAKAAAAKAPVVPAAAPVVEEEEEDDLELVAVIAAAIAAYEGTSPDGVQVRSIRKVNRSRR